MRRRFTPLPRCSFWDRVAPCFFAGDTANFVSFAPSWSMPYSQEKATNVYPP
jgi:hypothetical protein